MKWVLRIAAIAFVAFALWRAWQWMFVTDEMRVRRQIALLTGAVEKGDTLRLSDALASDYGDDWGLDKTTLLGAVRSYRTQYDPVFIHVSDLNVTIDPDHQNAQAVFIAKIIAKARGSLSDSEVREERFRLHFRKNDSLWELVRAESPELKFN